MAVVGGSLKASCARKGLAPQSPSVSSRLMVHSKWEGRRRKLGRGGRVIQSRPAQSR
jgi:hypothetical protein